MKIVNRTNSRHQVETTEGVKVLDPYAEISVNVGMIFAHEIERLKVFCEIVEDVPQQAEIKKEFPKFVKGVEEEA